MSSEFAREFRTNWMMLIIALILIFFTFGIPTYSMPFIYSGASEEFGWSRAEVTLLASFKYLTGAITGLVMGRLIDVFNPRVMVTWAAVLGGLAMLGFLFATNLGVYYFAGIVLGVSASGITVCMKVIVSTLFERGQGTAVGIVLAGTSLAGVVTPVLVVPMIEQWGWRATMALLSAGIWLVAIPGWLLLFRGQMAASSGIAMASAGGGTSGLWRHFHGLCTDRDFWMMASGVFLIGAVDMGMLQNQVLFLQVDKGLDITTVAWATSMLAGIGVAAKVIFGWFYDRYSIRGIMLTYLLLAISVLLAFPVAGVTSMFLFMVVRGIVHGGLIVEVPVLTKHYYGRENLGLNMGIMAAFLQLGMAFGPPMLGAAHDLFGSYTAGFIAACILPLVAALLLLPVRPRFWTPPADRSVVATAPAPVRGDLGRPNSPA
jgi:MFS family permease